MTADPALLDDLFARDIDGRAARFVRPADTDRHDFAVYDGDDFLGMLYSDQVLGTTGWRLGGTTERHGALDDAVRALRRPRSWPRERAQVSDWARRLLEDESLTAVDVETTGLNEPWAVQIAATDRDGAVLFDAYLDPRAEIEPGAVAVHKITPEKVAGAPTFGELLPALTEALHGRTCVAYNMPFDRECLERELRRHHGSVEAAARWLGGCRWHDAMEPYAVWKGLWSVKRGRYRPQKLGGPHQAVEDCRFLLARVREMADRPARG
ncbi:exonuclease domain-containing protein [Streptomyces sp. CA-250714]|uniref:3'-5' exonuclease n=1 Tax=Streptomyces sp. CA-250714 TaxID=3240060 RepID=UPI003D8D320B